MDALCAGELQRPDRAAERLPLHHLPHRRRHHDGADVRVPVRPRHHRPAAPQAGQGPADPRGRARHPLRQEGHADHGRAHDPVGRHRLDAAVGQLGQLVRVDRAVRDAQLRRHRLLRRLPEGHQEQRRRRLRQAALAGRDRCRRHRRLCSDARRQRGLLLLADGAVLQERGAAARRAVRAARHPRDRRAPATPSTSPTASTAWPSCR